MVWITDVASGVVKDPSNCDICTSLDGDHFLQSLLAVEAECRIEYKESRMQKGIIENEIAILERSRVGPHGIEHFRAKVRLGMVQKEFDRASSYLAALNDTVGNRKDYLLGQAHLQLTQHLMGSLTSLDDVGYYLKGPASDYEKAAREPRGYDYPRDFPDERDACYHQLDAHGIFFTE